MKKKLLIVDDEVKITKILSRILEEEGYDVTAVNTGEKGVDTAQQLQPDIVLMDLNLPGISGIEAMARIIDHFPDVIVILITAYGSISSAVEAMKKGAYDYITKPFDNDALIMTLRRAEEHLNMQKEILHLKDQLKEKYEFKRIVGQSSHIRTVFEHMERVAATDATVLVQGESGTGKELIVRAIHQASARNGKPFVALNCGAIPPNLVESRLFGHEKGAFTDAKERRIGCFEQADGGTLFLDEVGELSLDDQVKLLRAIEERQIVRVGGDREIPVDIRIIAATNKDLGKAVEAGAFRQDLYFRLNVFFIPIPPLRERMEDIPLLVDHFIDKYRQSTAPNVTGISQQAVQRLKMYDWPGNVRELQNAIQSALIMCREGAVLPRHLPLRIQGYPVVDDSGESGGRNLEDKVKKITDEVERNMILAALEEHDGSRTKAAETLGISRKTLFNKMQKYGID
ncbi:sigma-54-dependent Fis family transcriptional regulator [bacterium]|nr:sigma-54-dependent Fis family transcriptional regulator [bacterium]